MSRLPETGTTRIGARVIAPTQTEAINIFRQCMKRCDGDGIAAAKLLAKEDKVTFAVLEKSELSFEQLCELDNAMGENVNGGGEYF